MPTMIGFAVMLRLRGANITAAKLSCTSNGVFRKNSTYAVPIGERNGPPQTRRVAPMTPMTRAPSMPPTPRISVLRKPSKKKSLYSDSAGESSSMLPSKWSAGGPEKPDRSLERLAEEDDYLSSGGSGASAPE